MTEEFKKLIKENINGSDITFRERKILTMRLGLEDGIMHTLDETGKEFGITRERIRQIQAKVFCKIRRKTLNSDLWKTPPCAAY